MAIIRELVTRLGFTIDDAEARRYNRRLQDLGRRIRGFGRTMSLFVTAPIVGLGTAFVKAAADAEETENKFREVFKGITEDADAAAQSMTDNFDLATSSAQELLSATGDILVGFGFNRKAALDLSQQVNSLAVDIASFKNVQGGAAQASNAITKALLGEREMLKGLGIAILEEDVKLKVMQLRQEGMTFETERQAKSFATLRLVMDRSRDAIGDYARTSESATNQARRMRERFREVSVTFGKVLLPAATELLKMLTGLLEWLNSFSPGARRLIIIIAGITAALGPLLIVLGSIVTLVASLPLLITAAIAAVGALGFLIGEDIAAFAQGRKSVVGLIIEQVKRAFAFVFDQARSLIDRIMEYLSDTWLGWVAKNVTPLINQVRSLGAARQGAVGRGAIGGALSAISPTGAALFQAFRPMMAARAAAAQATESIVTVNQVITAAPGESAATTGQESAEAMMRALGEARARGAITPRMAP